MTEEITEAIRNAFNEYLNAIDKIILENQALQIELQRLKQENKELKEDVLKWQKEFSRQYQINENKGYSKAEENYRSALEEIKNNFMCFRSCMIPFHVGDKDNLPHKMADAIQNYCESIINKINEVLQCE